MLTELHGKGGCVCQYAKEGKIRCPLIIRPTSEDAITGNLFQALRTLNPLASTSQPARSSTACRAAARPTALPSPAPVGSPKLALGGSPRSSSIQRPAISSTAAAAGDAA